MNLKTHVFSEDVVLGGLKAGPSWFVGDHLLRMDSGTSDAEDVARLIADRNDLRYERTEAERQAWIQVLAVDSGLESDGENNWRFLTFGTLPDVSNGIAFRPLPANGVAV